MKILWRSCMAILAATATVGSANAQWNQPDEIGSYESILSRAGYGGYGTSGGSTTRGEMVSFTRDQDKPSPAGPKMQKNAVQDSIAVPPVAHEYTPTQTEWTAEGCRNGNCGCTGGNYYNIEPASCGNGGCRSDIGVVGRIRNKFANRHQLDYNGVVGNDIGLISDHNTTYDAPVYNAPAYNAPVYTPSCSPDSRQGNKLFGRLLNKEKEASNRVLGIFGVSFRRDYEDGQRIASNAAGTNLFSDDVDHGDFAGFGVSLTNRRSDGSGWETIFWELDEGDIVNLPGPNTTTFLSGLADVNYAPTGGSVEDVFNAGQNVQLIRDTDIYNFEFNLLRNGGQYTTRSGRAANFEILGGFRLFIFDESLHYVSNSPAPAAIEYSLEADNTLTGFQLGGRNEICLSPKVRLAHSASFGLFNNHIKTHQRIFDSNGVSALDTFDSKEDAAALGQIDVGLIYQLSEKSRARVGYRALGVAGVALAADQIPLDFTDTQALNSANSNGSLLLHGFYFGSEFCF